MLDKGQDPPLRDRFLGEFPPEVDAVEALEVRLERAPVLGEEVLEAFDSPGRTPVTSRMPW